MVKGFKAMTSDMTCRGFKFEEGKTYSSSAIEICKSGFHFCESTFDVYNYYDKSENTVVCEVEALGDVVKDGDKSVTNQIKIVKKLSDKELLKLWITRTNSGDGNSGNRNSGDGNSGYGNSGDGNSGDGNSGNRNSGNRNSGNRNSGDGNSGYGNSGYGNSGNWNSGNRNSGDGNSGYGNSGNGNSGDWNSGDGNSGYFNTEIPTYFFNKPSTVKWSQEMENRLRIINVKPIVTWTTTDSMTEEEMKNNPSHKITGGFLRKTDRMDWRGLTEDDKNYIKALPNFDDEVFKKISGISISKPKTVKVTVEGKEFEIDLEKAKELRLIKE